MGEEAFDAVHRIARIMRDFPKPWFVAGGWALDLFLGRVTRPHEDIEIAVLRRDHGDVREHLGGWEIRKAVPGTAGALEPWREGESLEPTVHELHAKGPGDVHLEILIDESEGDLWRFRRDPRVARPLALAVMQTADGVPVLAPEIVLLYKAKRPRAHDESDFTTALPHLDAERKAWLRAALDTVHPGHSWRARL